MDEITIEAVRSATDEVRDLIGELDRTLALEYSAEQRHGLSLAAIFEPHVRFFLARLDGLAAGCGGVALFGSFGEVKRMYERDGFRPCDAFGDYATMTPQAIATSVFLEKQLH
jgi:hypothetical protein